MKYKKMTNLFKIFKENEKAFIKHWYGMIVEDEKEINSFEGLKLIQLVNQGYTFEIEDKLEDYFDAWMEIKRNNESFNAYKKRLIEYNCNYNITLYDAFNSSACELGVIVFTLIMRVLYFKEDLKDITLTNQLDEYNDESMYIAIKDLFDNCKTLPSIDSRERQLFRELTSIFLENKHRYSKNIHNTIKSIKDIKSTTISLSTLYKLRYINKNYVDSIIDTVLFKTLHYPESEYTNKVYSGRELLNIIEYLPEPLSKYKDYNRILDVDEPLYLFPVEDNNDNNHNDNHNNTELSDPDHSLFNEDE
jgi:hypothetical protein